MTDRCPVAVLDANLFVPTWVIDPLMCLAEAGLYEPVWSERILAEVRDAMVRVRGISHGAAEHMTAMVNAAFPFAMTDGWEPLQEGVLLPDPDDRHVVAAARQAGADVIVTFNLKDFPASMLVEFGLRAESPDEFLAGVYDAHPDVALAAVRALVSSKTRPPRTMVEEIEGLRRLRLAAFAQRIQEGMMGSPE